MWRPMCPIYDALARASLRYKLQAPQICAKSGASSVNAHSLLHDELREDGPGTKGYVIRILHQCGRKVM